jgi:hypothetical protein
MPFPGATIASATCSSDIGFVMISDLPRPVCLLFVACGTWHSADAPDMPDGRPANAADR